MLQLFTSLIFAVCVSSICVCANAAFVCCVYVKIANKDPRIRPEHISRGIDYYLTSLLFGTNVETAGDNSETSKIAFHFI